MKNNFSIGDMAKIHNISTQTLRYYDKIGLLKPKIVDESNGYRYYTIEQFEQLETVKYLKFLGMSLADIKQHFEKSSKEDILKLLEKQRFLTYKKMQQLEIITNKIDNRINCIKNCSNQVYYDTVRIREIEERNIVFEYINDADSPAEFELSLKNLQSLFEDNYLMSTREIGVIVPMEDLKMNRFDRYNGVYILVEDKVKCTKVKKIPAGKYACIYHKGSYKETYRSYEKLLKYINDNNYELAGDGVEVGLIDCSLISNEDEYVTEIEIPIK